MLSLRLVEMANGAIKLVAATGIAETYDVTEIVREGVRLHWFTRPGASLIDGIGDIQSAPLVALRLVEMADGAFKRVAATGVTKPYNIAVMSRERIELHRIAGPRTGLINAIGDIKDVHRDFRSSFQCCA